MFIALMMGFYLLSGMLDFDVDDKDLYFIDEDIHDDEELLDEEISLFLLDEEEVQH